MTGTLNAFVYGTWSKYEDAPVTVLELTPNGRACYVRFDGEKKRRGPIPLRWVSAEPDNANPQLETERVEAAECCPTCGREL